MKALSWLGFASLLLALSLHVGFAQEPPSAFVTETIYTSPNGITALEFDHGGRMLAAEKLGNIVLFAPDGAGGFVTPPTSFANLTAAVASASESGLLGMALDPSYATNGYIYLCYTTRSAAGGDMRVTRITANAAFSAMVPGSEVVLLEDLPKEAAHHKAGDIHFSPADPDAIYVSLGDDAKPDQAQVTTRYEGKVLRIRKDNGRGFPDNPYFDGNPDSIASRVWARGFRNPFRFTFHPTVPSRDVLYSSDNGDGTDRLSRVEVGSNGEWNGDDSAGFTSPSDPRHRVLRLQNPSVVGIAISPSGPFGTNVIYWGRIDGGGGAIHRYQLEGANLDTAIPLDGGAPFLSGAQSVIDMSFGPDGSLYGTSTGEVASGGAWPIRRIRYLSDAPPLAAFVTDPAPAAGEAPLTVQFTDQSTAPGSSIALHAWTFGDGAGSAQANPTHRYEQAGVYEARLTVTNTAGLQSTTASTVRALRTVEVELSGTVFDAGADVLVGLPDATQLRFYQADGVSPLAFAGGQGADANALPVTPGGSYIANLRLPLTSDGFVVSAGEPTSDNVQPVKRGFVLPAASGVIVLQADFYLARTAVAGRVRDTAGGPLIVDVGIRRLGIPYRTPAGRDYLPGTVAASGVAHRLQTDALGWFAFPVRTGDAAVAFQIDAVADTQTTTFAPVMIERVPATASLEMVELVAGRWSGGADCDDLSGIAPTPAVDFATQIQRDIFSAECTGCHHAGAVNSGGLDLTEGGSLADLIGRASAFAPGVSRVAPGDASRSFLMEKVGCATPQSGTRMRPGSPMSPASQALLRDWINQLSAPVAPLFRDGFESAN